MRIVLVGVLTVIVSSFTISQGKENRKENTISFNNENRISKLAWIIGTWTMETSNGILTESWQRINDSLYSGYSTFVSKRGNILFSEHIKLQQIGDSIYYKPTIGNQNSGKEIVFIEMSLSNNEIVFENPTHDYPQRIIYRRMSDSTLYARIEGKKRKKIRQEEFNYRKK